jgi:hypothetical protein
LGGHGRKIFSPSKFALGSYASTAHSRSHAPKIHLPRRPTTFAVADEDGAMDGLDDTSIGLRLGDELGPSLGISLGTLLGYTDGWPVDGASDGD